MSEDTRQASCVQCPSCDNQQCDLGGIMEYEVDAFLCQATGKRKLKRPNLTMPMQGPARLFFHTELKILVSKPGHAQHGPCKGHWSESRQVHYQLKPQHGDTATKCSKPSLRHKQKHAHTHTKAGLYGVDDCNLNMLSQTT